jgi:hypothetical protein
MGYPFGSLSNASFFSRQDVQTIVGIGQRFVLLGQVEAQQRLGYECFKWNMMGE